MILPQELIIGNYVFDIDGDVLQIGQILDIGVKFKNTSLSSRYEKIQPIPLTEEILLKFGFIRNKIKTISEVIDVSGNDKLLEFEVTEMGLDLWISSDKIDEALYFPVNYIKYAHNLQNLYFALTGEELTF